MTSAADFLSSLQKVLAYCEKKQWTGYDPYDVLLSPFPFRRFGKWPAIAATQIQKRNPFQLRPLLGIPPQINPKAMALFLQAYSLLYASDKKQEYLQKADFFFRWLKENASPAFSGKAWGYPFPWISPLKFIPAGIPSAVVTAFVSKGVYEYYLATTGREACEVLENISSFILNDLHQTSDHTGICFSYTPLARDCCYNASLLAAETLAMTYSVTGKEDLRNLLRNKISNSLGFILSRQKADGRWNYSLDETTGREREQIDFHQGFVLESLYEIVRLTGIMEDRVKEAVIQGLFFYREKLFDSGGRARWRYPRSWPSDIHHLAQGVITFTKLDHWVPGSAAFAEKIASWTVRHMQKKDGSFSYRKHRWYTNSLSYMRWGQAWMVLALTVLTSKRKNGPDNKDTLERNGQ